MRRLRRTGGISLVDILFAASILGIGGISLTLMISRNRALTQAARNRYQAQEFAISLIEGYHLRAFSELQATFGDDGKNPPLDEIDRSMRSKRQAENPAMYALPPEARSRIRFYQVASMPEIGYLDVEITYTDPNSRRQKERVVRMMVDPGLYSGSLAASQMQNEVPGETPADRRDPPPDGKKKPDGSRRSTADGTRVTDGGFVSSDEFEALEKKKSPVYDMQRVSDEMRHDASHRGEMSLDLFNIARSMQETAAGASGGYDWSKAGEATFDPARRLEMIEEVLRSRPIPDGSYRYDFRQESFTVEHKTRTFMIYDLQAVDGKRYLLVKRSDDKGEGSQIESAPAFNLGDHTVIREGVEPEGPARVWSTRKRLYTFEESSDPSRNIRSPTLRLNIQSYEADLADDGFPQSFFPDSPGYVGDELRAMGIDPATAPAATGSAREARPSLGA